MIPFLFRACIGSGLFACAAAVAAVQVAMPFSDHMVLQAGQRVPVWGTASPGEKITVQLAGQTHTTVAGSDGTWRLAIPALEYAPNHAPQTLIVRGASDETRISDVLVGEVWLCSGQSNMRFTLGRRAEPRDEKAPLLFPEALANSAHARVRLLNVTGGTPAERKWAACGPDTTAAFSAIGYFFGAALEQARDVPVGLIDLGRGGAAIRAFLPGAIIDARKDLKELYKPEPRTGFSDGPVFAEVALLAPFALRGVLWYQGEGDASRAALYPALLGTMIAEWRRVFDAPELPFLIVQLPAWERRRTDPPRTSTGVKWAELREAQRLVTQEVPHTTLVPIPDLGERLDIHPRRKREVGERLAQVARASVYAEPISHQGPLLKSSDRQDGTIVLTFAHAEGGLFAMNEQLADFEVAGEDGRFVAAQAVVTGHDKITVRVPAGVDGRHVRYAWRDYFVPSLFNGDGWPAAPFRTDTFPLTTSIGTGAAAASVPSRR